MHHRPAFRVADDAGEAAGAVVGPGQGRALAQPGVEMLPVDHADEAVADGHVDPLVGR